MAIGLVGRKAGMTRIFTDAGETVPVTVIEVLPNRITQVKAQDKNGYRAVQVTYGTRRPSLLSKAVAGHYARANVAPGKALVEFRLSDADKEEFKTGTEIKADLFKEGEKVDVTGTTIGKGFAGAMKRHNFAGLPATHGVSVSHRSPGSIGQRQTPGRVFKVVGVDMERNLLLIRGAVPGAEGGQVLVRTSLKAARLAKRKTVAPSKAGSGPSKDPAKAGKK
jgi:large subunit ribosomal protein L3